MSANTTLDKLLADVPLLTKTLNYHIVPGVAMVPISGVRTGSLFATALGPQSQILVDNTWVACAWLACTAPARPVQPHNEKHIAMDDHRHYHMHTCALR